MKNFTVLNQELIEEIEFQYVIYVCKNHDSQDLEALSFKFYLFIYKYLLKNSQFYSKKYLTKFKRGTDHLIYG